MNEYRIPTSAPTEELFAEQIPESAEVRAYRAEQEAKSCAEAIHRVDPTDIDSKRTETFGAAMVAAAQDISPATPEVFNPADPAQLLEVGRGILALRQKEFTLAA